MANHAVRRIRKALPGSGTAHCYAVAISNYLPTACLGEFLYRFNHLFASRLA